MEKKLLVQLFCIALGHYANESQGQILVIHTDTAVDHNCIYSLRIHCELLLKPGYLLNVKASSNVICVCKIFLPFCK